jgi:hypothetical protein
MKQDTQIMEATIGRCRTASLASMRSEPWLLHFKKNAGMDETHRYQPRVQGASPAERNDLNLQDWQQDLLLARQHAMAVAKTIFS